MSAALLAATFVIAPPAGLFAQRGDPCRFDQVCGFLARNIGLTPPLTLAKLRRFAKLEGDSATPVANAHVAGQVDRVHELRYPGLTVRAYVPATGPVLLQRIEVTSARYALPNKLTLGKSTFDDVQFALGLAKDIQHIGDGSSRWRYDNAEGTASVIFEFEAEPSRRIRRVEWRYKVD
ncbi:MAG: hypothetical protein ACHQQ3_06535 [Gemmatimonadales bacterium]